MKWESQEERAKLKKRKVRKDKRQGWGSDAWKERGRRGTDSF